jgi:hypothetical protein
MKTFKTYQVTITATNADHLIQGAVTYRIVATTAEGATQHAKSSFNNGVDNAGESLPEGYTLASEIDTKEATTTYQRKHDGLVAELENALCHDPVMNRTADEVGSGLDWNWKLCQEAAAALLAE